MLSAKALTKAALRALVQITPKLRVVVLRGFPSYEDNLVSVYERLAVRGVRNVVWITDDVTIRPPIEVGLTTRFIKRGTWRDYFYSIFARYLFITHGHFIADIPANQICVNLWHGIPYKVIGKMAGEPGRQDTFLVATSDLTKDIFAHAFGVDDSRVVVTGQARTDRLFLRNPEALREKVLKGHPKARNVLLWLPTYRATQHIGGRVDGKDFGSVFNCSTFDEVAFNCYLARNDAVCFVKPHPMALRATSRAHSNLIFIDENWLLEKGMTLYQLCGVANCLVSDISSVIVDFMLLDRPIVLLFEDLLEYRRSRGFSFNPIEDWLPAPVNTDFESFLVELDAVLRGEDRYSVLRNTLKQRFFKFSDNRSTDRILDFALPDLEEFPTKDLQKR